MFEKVLLRDNPCISPQRCDEVVLKIVLKSLSVKIFYLSKYLLEKISFLFLFPLDDAILLLRNR